MSKRHTPTEETKQRGGGNKTAAPLWAFGIILLLAWFGLWHYYLAGRDTLLGLVPSEAAVYIHAQGNQAGRPLMMVPQIELIQPSESALFITEDADSRQSTILLRWWWPASPTDDDLALLASVGAVKIDDRTYALGATDLVLHNNIEDSLARHELAGPALASLRGASRVQGYMKQFSAGQLATALLSGIDSADSSMVFAATWHERAKLVLVKTDKAADWLGLKVPQSRSGVGALPLLEPAEDISTALQYSTNKPDFSVASLIFTDILAQKTQLNVPDSAELDQAKLAMAKYFDQAVALTISNRSTATGLTRFALFLPETEAKTLNSDLNTLWSLAIPSQISFVRPDLVKETEFIITEQQHQYQLRQLDDATILASDPEMMSAALNSLTNLKAEQKYCMPGATEVIHTHNLKFFPDYLPILSFILNYPQLENGVIQRNGDNYLIFCG